MEASLIQILGGTLAVATEALVFYIVGGVLALIAVALAFTGLRGHEFPSPGLMRIMIPAFALVVVAAAATAVIAAREEQRERRAHTAEAEEHGEEEGAEEAPDEGSGQGGGEAPGEASAEQGTQVFLESGCGGCHVLAAAETDGTTGPNLDEALEGRDRDYIRTAIVDPNAEIAEGFPEGVMPGTYGDQLSDEQIDQLVALLFQG